ncbi:PREDICTED: centrosomal protein of 55 kDa-like [Cyprinodon variegatus]|uniref:centrosomal protein of 55 kDa-like n=1 Tax=Cyprinodon variegatus TaxID=28743 RepID=UPI000742994D|nr:PREDICTED: centrosomal protein of 55 kDa-like [Cyprinodon variegatus]
MAAYKCNRSHRKKLNSELVKAVSSLRKENILLKKTLADVSDHHRQHNKLVERLLALETLRLESCQHLLKKDEKTSPSSEDRCPKEKHSMDGDPPSEQVSSNDEAILHLQNDLSDALEKSKQWLEYDQQREAYMRAILDKVLWLEKQLSETNQARSKQHNEEHSDEETQKQIEECIESYEKEVDVKLDMLRKQDKVFDQVLVTAKEEEEQQLKNETKELQAKLKEERRRSTNLELQASFYQRYVLNHHYADQEEIADLKRQIKISAQDLEDAKRDSSYLKKQMLRILKKLPKTKGLDPKQSKTHQQDVSSCEEGMPHRDSPESSFHTSRLDQSFLECPSCQAEYPASQYRQLLEHLEMCVE